MPAGYSRPVPTAWSSPDIGTKPGTCRLLQGRQRNRAPPHNLVPAGYSRAGIYTDGVTEYRRGYRTKHATWPIFRRDVELEVRAFCKISPLTTNGQQLCHTPAYDHTTLKAPVLV